MRRKSLPLTAVSPLVLSPLVARRFALRATGLEQPFESMGQALTHLGYVQIDPLNICGRMHDLILRNRVIGYREGDLMRHLHGAAATESVSAEPERIDDARPLPLRAGERTAFEHHHPETHVLVAFPLEAWPHLLAAMNARTRRGSAWMGKLTPRERELASILLQEIERRGPLGSEDFQDNRRATRGVWGKTTLVKSTLQKLFFHGRLLIASRVKHRRQYDLPERVLPATTLAQPSAATGDTTRWLAVLKLRQRRLVRLKAAELAAVTDLVQPITVAGCPLLHCLKSDVSCLESCTAESPVALESPVRLLAPLDPLIYDRDLTARLWNFDYTWEAYTPAAKRVRGHYALPVLAGTELVGHVEPKAERQSGRLRVASRAVQRGHITRPAVVELARWLGLK